MKLLDLHQFERFRDRDDVKVLRHKDSRKDLWELRSKEKFNHYQNEQGWNAFGNARYVISFIAERNREAKFVGVWEVFSRRKRKRGKGFRYRTRELPGFDKLERRLIVHWGEGTKSWTQWLHRKGNKEIAEILPLNYVDFPGYYDFALPYDELATIINNPESNREWQKMLSAVSGVYVLLDKKSGKQYVGSAYGRGGIWARWKKYVNSRTGGNAVLEELLRSSPGRYKSFQFSILRVLEPGSMKKEVIAQEICTKGKLGSRAFGLNSN